MEQKTILFMMLSAYGHLNCTFSFAKRLQKEGYSILYLVAPGFEKLILEQHFEVLSLDPKFVPLRLGPSSASFKVNTLLHRLSDRIADLDLEEAKMLNAEMNKVVRHVKPDLIFLDAFNPYTYFLLEGEKPPLILLQIMLNTKRLAGIPPLNSKRIPAKNNDMFHKFLVKWDWWKYNWSITKKEVLGMGQTNIGVTSRLLNNKKKRSAFKAQLDFSYAFHPGIKGIRQFILAPKSLDFPEISSKNQLYLASSIHANRTEDCSAPEIQDLRYRLQVSHKEKVWVYCSLGTLNISHNDSCFSFFKAVIAVFKRKPSWRLILATGEMDPNQFGVLPHNVRVFKRVPQLEVLKYCRVMITHAGINSMLECIQHRVPMLAYPLNDDWDQNGNAARIVYYQLGLRGILEHATNTLLEEQLNLLIESPVFLEAIDRMREKIYAEDGLQQAVEYINNLVYNPQKSSLSLSVAPTLETFKSRLPQKEKTD